MRRRLKSQLDVDTLAPLLILTGLLASCGPAVTPEPAGGAASPIGPLPV